MVDDKETKNIDGIIPPEDGAQKAPEKITVSEEESTPADESSTDVNISSDGDIAVEQATEQTVEPVESAPEVPVAEAAPQEPTQQTVEQPAKDDDPGIVPSVQPVQAAAASPATEVARLKERTKHLKIWLVILMLLLVAVASALVVYFAGQSKAKNDLKAQQQANAELQTQLAEAQQADSQRLLEELNAEKAKNATLQQTVDEQKQQITAYQTAIKDLLKQCGTACSTVDVPDDTTTTNTTN